MQDALLAPRVGAARLGSAARRAPTAGPAGYYKLGGGGDGARERMGPAGVSRLGEGRTTTLCAQLRSYLRSQEQIEPYDSFIRILQSASGPNITGSVENIMSQIERKL